MDLIRKFFEALADRINKQPVATSALIKAALAAAIAFGLKWSVEQLGAVVMLSELLLGWWTYGKVTPTASPSLPAGTTVNEGSGSEVVIPEGDG